MSRADQDALRSSRIAKAVAAQAAGKFTGEIVPVEIAGRSGTTTVERRRSRRAPTPPPTRSPSSSRCSGKDGTVTAGNAPGLNDGGAALVVTSLAFAKANGLTPMARITAYATGGGEPKDLFFAPVLAVQNLMKKAGTTIGDYDLIEANEAFAVQAVADGRGARLGLGSRQRQRRRDCARPSDRRDRARACWRRCSTRCRIARRAAGLATLCLGGGNAVALSVEAM